MHVYILISNNHVSVPAEITSCWPLYFDHELYTTTIGRCVRTLAIAETGVVPIGRCAVRFELKLEINSDASEPYQLRRRWSSLLSPIISGERRRAPLLRIYMMLPSSVSLIRAGLVLYRTEARSSSS